MRILVVDDEPAVRDAVDRALRLDGPEVSLAEDGRAALDALAAAPPDALVLDLLMPHVDGLEVCRRLRAAGDRTPVLVLTARDAVADRVRGLDAGADDYLVKPFALKELKARLRALLRRTGPETGAVLRCGDLMLDPLAHEVRRGAPQPRAHACQQLLERERLDEVVVGARVEPADAIGDRVARCQDENRRAVAGGAQPAADLEPVDVRHQQVEHERVRRRHRHRVERGAAVGRERHLVAVEPQRPVDGVAHGGLVVGHEDPHRAGSSAVKLKGR